MNTKYLISVIALTGSLGLITSNAEAQRPHTVDCDRGDSLNDAVNRQVGHAGPIIIDVIGTCTEDVNIARDDVTINGNNTGVVSGTVIVDGARRLNVTNITLTGTGLGMDVFGGQVNLFNVVVTGNQVAGVASNTNAYVGIFDSTISNNSTHGVLALQGSSVLVRNTIVNNNNNAGIDATNGATATVESSTISGNDRGIVAFVNSNAIVKDSNINGNTGVGIIAEAGGTLLIQEGTTISGNLGDGVQAVLHSNVRILDSVISNNTSSGIFISADSGVRTLTNVTISGNGGAGVFCEDTESSFQNSNPVDDTVSCTDFNQ